MALTDSELLHHWKEENKPDKATQVKVSRWIGAAVMPEEALEIVWEAKDWFKDRTQPTPDFLACVAWYGKTRLMLQGMKPPITVPVEDFDRWRKAGYYMTIEDFQERLAGVAGGFLRLAGRDPQLFVNILQQQLETKLQLLEALVDKPLSEYTPKITETALTARFRAEGLDEAQVKMFVEETLHEDDWFMENKRLDQPFALYEELICFEWGMEKFSMFAISEHSEKLNLPNKELYEALGQIDLNGLLARLGEAEHKLKAILHHLAKHRYFDLDDDTAPEGFWWRHWQEEMDKQRQDRQARGGHKPHRNSGNSRKPSSGQKPQPDNKSSQ